MFIDVTDSGLYYPTSSTMFIDVADLGLDYPHSNTLFIDVTIHDYISTLQALCLKMLLTT